MNHREIINPYRSLYRTMIVAAFLLNAIALFGFGVGNRDIAFWIGSLQFALFGLGIGVLIIGRIRAHTVSTSLRDNTILAQWTLSNEEADRWAKRSYARNKNVTSIAMIIALIAGPVIALRPGSISMESGFFLGVLLGGITFVTGRMYAYDSYRRHLSPPSDVVITKNHVLLLNDFYQVNGAGSVLKHAGVIASTDAPGSAILSLTVSYVYLLQQTRSLSIPVPKNSKEKAEHIVRVFSTGTIPT